MPFKWFGKNDQQTTGATRVATILSWPNREFAEFAYQAIQKDVPATRAMSIVAYANLGPILAAAMDASRKTEGTDFGIAQLIEMTLKRLDSTNDEFAQRRLIWFFLAALVYRLDTLASEDLSLIEIATDVWLSLSDAGQYLANLLEHNVVWSHDEKAYFSNLKTQQDGIWYVMKIMVPNQYKSQPKLKAFAKSYGIFL